MRKYEKPIDEKEKLRKAEKDYKVSQKKLHMYEFITCPYPPKQKALLDRQRAAIGFLEKEAKNLELDVGISQKRYDAEEGDCLTKVYNLIEKENELAAKIEEDKLHIKSLTIEINDIKKAITAIHKQGFHENKISEKIKKEHVKIQGFENTLQVATNKFGDLLVQSEKHREKICVLLDGRKLFHTKYIQLYRQLLKGKQTMLDIVEQASKVCDQKEDTSRKLKSLQEKTAEEVKNHTEWVQALLRELDKSKELDNFLSEKNEKVTTGITSNDEESASKTLFMEEIGRKIEKYSNIIQDIKTLYNEERLNKLTDRYEAIQEGNIGLVCYVNNKNNETLALQDQITEMNNRILQQQELRESRVVEQETTLRNMTEMLESKTAECQKVVQEMKLSEEILDNLLTNLESMYIGFNCDSKNFPALLGDNAHVNVFNYHSCLTQIESQLHELMYLVYSKEMMWIPEFEDESEALVQEDYHIILSKRPINYYIDSLSPCPLCLETMRISNLEEDNRLDTLEEFESVRDEIKTHLATQTVYEILHNLSKCQLPRSRAIMQARFQEQEGGR